MNSRTLQCLFLYLLLLISQTLSLSLTSFINPLSQLSSKAAPSFWKLLWWQPSTLPGYAPPLSLLAFLVHAFPAGRGGPDFFFSHVPASQHPSMRPAHGWGSCGYLLLGERPVRDGVGAKVDSGVPLRPREPCEGTSPSRCASLQSQRGEQEFPSWRSG